MRVAFLGLGRMGQAMAGHVLDGGHELVVWNRTPGRAGDLVGRGATEAGSVREAVTGADRVALMLFGPDAVREVLAEVVEAAAEGTLVVDCTTVGTQDARGFARTCAERGLRYVDAPVAGSLPPAREGTLGVLAGASEEDFVDARELLVLWGDEAKVKRVGQVGAGSAMKLVNNLALAFTIAGVGEAMRLGHDLGLERTALLGVLAGTSLGGMVAYKRPLLDAGDYSETAFSLELLAKDIGLAVDAADSEMRVTRAILGAVEAAMDAGHSQEDFAVLAEHLAGEGRADSH